MKSQTRRSFLKTVGIGSAAFCLSGLSAFRQKAFAATTYTGVTYLTPAYRALMYGVNGFVDYLRQNHAEDVTIDFFDSGTLVNADSQVPALRAGTIQFMVHTTSYITRSFPILGITGLPGLCEELYEHGERLAMESPLWTLMNDQLAKDNLFMLTSGGGLIEPEYIWSGKNKVASLTDLNGKRCRVVSYEATESLKNFGIAGVRIPSSETYLALQRGTVDALVANISTIMGRRLHEQLKYCYKLPVTGLAIPIFFLKNTWDNMPEKEKAAFWAAGKWYDENDAKIVNGKFYPDEYWPAMKEAGLEVFEPTAEELAEFTEKSQPIWNWWKNEVGEEVGQKTIELALGNA